MDPFLGEIRIFCGNFAPLNWAFCNGSLIAIRTNTALYSLLGNTYGGDGVTTFALPDLRGRVPIHAGSGPGLTPRALGAMEGTETVRLMPNEMPAHSHTAQAKAAEGGRASPGGNLWAEIPEAVRDEGQKPLYAQSPNTTMNPMALGPSGGGGAHTNRQPYLGVNYIIALQGVFPSRP